MPTYDYLCKKCKHSFEYFQSMSNSHLKKCPECNGPVRRLVSGGSGLIFKGSGFYLTDYAKKTNPKEKTVSEKNKVSEKKKVSSKVSKKESKKS